MANMDRLCKNLFLTLMMAILSVSSMMAVSAEDYLIVDDDSLAFVDPLGNAYCDNDNDTSNTIRGAVDAAADGMAIIVCPGTYNECLAINKAITVSGTDRDTTIIDATGCIIGTSYIVLLSNTDETADVKFENFTLVNDNPLIYGASYGIAAANDDFTTIYNPIIKNVNLENVNVAYGIYSDISSGLVIENSVIKNACTGIYLINSNSAVMNNNLISSNGVRDECLWDVSSSGVFMTDSMNVVMANNTITDSYRGAYLTYSSGIIMRDSELSNNCEGALIESGSNAKISGTDFSDNNPGAFEICLSSPETGLKVDLSSYVELANGDFINNGDHAILGMDGTTVNWLVNEPVRCANNTVSLYGAIDDADNICASNCEIYVNDSLVMPDADENCDGTDSKTPPTSGGGISCVPDWECGDYGECGPDGLQIRTCADASRCYVPRNESKNCTYRMSSESLNDTSANQANGSSPDTQDSDVATDDGLGVVSDDAPVLNGTGNELTGEVIGGKKPGINPWLTFGALALIIALIIGAYFAFRGRGREEWRLEEDWAGK